MKANIFLKKYKSKIINVKSWFFEEIPQIDKTWLRLIRKIRGGTSKSKDQACLQIYSRFREE